MKGKGNILALACFSTSDTSIYFPLTASRIFGNQPGEFHVEGLVQFIFAHVLEPLRRDRKALDIQSVL